MEGKELENRSHETNLEEEKNQYSEWMNQYLGLVIKRAKVYASLTPCDWEELASVGKIGLLKSIHLFDSTRGTKFISFARKYIDGEILHFINKEEVTRRNTISLSTPISKQKEEGVITLEDVLVNESSDIEESLVEKDTLSCMRRLVEELPPRENQIFTEYFGLGEEEPKRMREIASHVGVNESTICRIIKANLLVMRASLEDVPIRKLKKEVRKK